MSRPSRFGLVLIALVSCVSCDRSKTQPRVPADLQADAAIAERAPQARRFIDTHTHTNAPAYDLILRELGPRGLQRFINLSGGSSSEARAENLAVADQFGGRVLLFHNIDWDDIDNPNFGVEEAARLEVSVRAGFAGVKVSKALGLGVRTEDGALVAVDDARLDPIWARAGQLGVPIAIHTADPRAFFEPPTPDNERFAELSLAPGWSFYGDEFPSRAELLESRDRLIANHPATTFILLHLGNNPEDVDYVDELLQKNRNALVDVAARVGEFGRHPAAKMKAFFERHAERVVFGTDIMMGVVPGPRGDPRLRLTLGSISKEPPTLESIAPFYESHFRYFEGTDKAIAHPVPIQGDWNVHPVGLGHDVLQKIYLDNAERVIAAPWLARRAANAVRATAAQLGR